MTKNDDQGSEKCSFWMRVITVVVTMRPLSVSMRHRVFAFKPW
jgi:hypothetical protein